MSLIIICSTKILTLAITWLFFISGVLCDFAMVPGVYIVLLSSQEEEMHSSS